jgi:hypothetical protein
MHLIKRDVRERDREMGKGKYLHHGLRNPNQMPSGRAMA